MGTLKTLAQKNQRTIKNGGIMLKKITIFLLITLISIMLMGCNDESVDNNETDPQESNVTETEVIESYSYTYNGTKIEINSKAEAVLEDLGEEINYFESESCAFPGLDKVYTYPGLEIQTYEIEGVDHILSVNILDDTIGTNKGIRLFDSSSKVIETYGENYEENAGQYIYKKGETKLSFLIKDDEVIAIEYAAIVEETK